MVLALRVVGLPGGTGGERNVRRGEYIIVYKRLQRGTFWCALESARRSMLPVQPKAVAASAAGERARRRDTVARVM